MINTQTQIDSLIDLAVIQRTELKQLVESLPQLRDHLSSEIERNLEEIEPAIRSELEQFVAARALDTQAKTSAELSAKLDAMARNLESTTAAKYSVLMAERAQNATLLAQAEARIAEAASALPGAVKGIVTDELSRFPRAGEIDQLRREFAEPRGLNPRGRWQVGETYNKLDLVSYNGDSYVSSTDGNREKPSRSTDAWTLSAARGNGGGGGGVTSLTDLVAVPANGELLIGNGSAFVNNTITGGTGVTVTNGPGTITIDASGAQELLTATVTNAESFAITRGQVVYLFGATGNRASVKLADNSNDAASSKTFGVVSEASISAGGNGLVTCVGVVTQLTLGTYTEGDVLYLGATPGAFTNVKPYAPNHLVYVGMVERANNGNGEVYVRIQNGFELDEIHDVQITTPPLAGALLMRDATNSLWKANRLTGTANQVTVTNADTAVTLSLPTAIANVNSVTAQSATNLTLAGGSTGASLVLGATTSGVTTLSNAGAQSVRIDQANRVIIGTGGALQGDKLEIQGIDGSAAQSIWRFSADLSGPFLTFRKSRGATIGIQGLLSSGDTVGSLLFMGSDGVASRPAAQIWTEVDGVAASGSMPGRIVFATTPTGSTTLATAATLTSTRNLLIGTTTDISGTGGLKVAGTSTASSTTSGALQVGSNVGLSGNAGGASYFGGSLSIPANTFLTVGTYVGTTGFKQDTPTTDALEVWNKGLKVALFGQSQMTMLGAAGGGRFVNFATGTSSASLRWVTGANGTAESGSNAGSDYAISSYNDAGAFIATPFSIVRATGAATFAGAVTVSGGSNTTSAGAVNLTSSSYGGGYTLKDGTKYLGLFSKNSGTQLCFYTNQAAGTDLGSVAPDLIINTATSTFASAVAVSSTTASTNTTSGALVVTGGVGVGGALNVGGAVTVATNLSVGAASGVLSLGADARASDTFLDINTAAANSRLLRFQTAGVARWQMGASSTAESGSNTGSNWVLNAYSDAGALLSAPLSIVRSTGAATFAGAVAIGNTVNTVSPTSPNRTVTMVIGGVTYYLAAKTTND